MVPGIVLAKMDGANQASQLLAASGKTFTVGKVSTAAGGMGSMLTLTPTGGAGSAVVVKLESARQLTELTALAGKTVTIGKSSMVMGAGANAGNWLILQPTAVAAAKTTASSATLIKLEGARQGMQASSLAGKNFTIIHPLIAGKGAGATLFLQPVGGGDLVAMKMANAAPAASSLLGKTVTVGHAPLVAGKTGSWLVLKPAAGATAAKIAVGGATAKTVAMTTMPQTGVAAATKTGIAGATAVKTAAATGTIWNGTGLSLGLGLGLGVWGPAILAGVGAAAVYGYVKKRKGLDELSDEDIELTEALNSGA